MRGGSMAGVSDEVQLTIMLKSPSRWVVPGTPRTAMRSIFGCANASAAGEAAARWGQARWRLALGLRAYWRGSGLARLLLLRRLGFVEGAHGLRARLVAVEFRPCAHARHVFLQDLLLGGGARLHLRRRHLRRRRLSSRRGGLSFGCLRGRLHDRLRLCRLGRSFGRGLRL